MSRQSAPVDRRELLREDLPFWDKLSPAEAEEILRESVYQKFEAGQLLSRTDRNCLGALILLSGQIRVFMTSEEGREVSLLRLYPGELCMLSASCLLDSIQFEYLIDAPQETEAILIPSRVFGQIMKDNPYVELSLAKEINRRYGAVMWSLQQILFMGVDRRLAATLLRLTEKNGSAVITCTHDQIASEIGSAREVVSRMLKYFAEEGIVELGRGRVTVTDPEKLKRYA